MTHDTVIAGGRLVTPQATFQGNLGITAGRIAAVAQEPLEGHEVVDARGRVVLPGAVDLHVHFNEPCPTEDKARGEDDNWQAWGGITDIQTLMPLMLAEGVHRRGLPLDRLAELSAEAPAKIARLWPRKGALQVGADADLVIMWPGHHAAAPKPPADCPGGVRHFAEGYGNPLQQRTHPGPGRGRAGLDRRS